MRARPRPITIPLALFVLAASLVVASPALAAATCFGRAVTIEGGDGDDVIDLTGNPGQVVATFGGDDLVIGSSGSDTVCLGNGADVFRGKGGADEADGGDGDDRLLGGGSDDRLFGGGGNDLIKGHGGDDELEGGSGNDVLRGSSGADHISGGPGNDLVKGGSGPDRLNGGDATTSNASSGDDRVNGNRGSDRLWSNWSPGDFDPDGTLNGGAGYDYCVNGAAQSACERDHRNALDTADPLANEWYSLVDEVFARWGLDEEDCETPAGEAEFCVGDQRANAVRVLMCESNGWPFAENAAGPAGLFQHHMYYWQGRVDYLLEHYSGIEPGFSADSDPFDPESSVVMTAMLVYESKAKLLGWEPYPGAGVSSEYPQFDFDTYAAHYYDRYDPGSGGPTQIIYGGYPNVGEGPNPWGHWISCGAYDTVWASGQNLYDPGWIHPWDHSPLPGWWPTPPPG